MTGTPILALEDVQKSFGPIEVLHGVDLALYPGEVHALVGENGAGKSTTMKIMSGFQPQSAGRVLLDGAEVTFDSLHDGEDAGVVMIHQEFNLAEQLSVEENVFLGRELKRGLVLDHKAMRAETQRCLDRLNCTARVTAPVASLSNSDKQMVEIAKALSRDVRVLIMDEPTAVLTKTEADILFEQVEALKEAGTAILFTSHKLDEVARLADRVTVMRDGAVVHHGPGDAISEDQMAKAMVGRDVSDLFPAKPATEDRGAVLLSVQNLLVPGYAEGISFDLHAGEILGIGGMMGSGRTEAMEGLAGLRKASCESLTMHGAPTRIQSPADAQAQGLSYLTEDRKLKGLVLGWQMTENLTLASLRDFARPIINRGAEDAALSGAIDEFDIRAGSRTIRVGNLSGGNQQKLLLAKTMLSKPRILIVDEPTRGIDIGTKQQIYTFLRRLADDGLGIIMISSEMTELVGLSDRVLVMRQGRISGSVAGPDLTEEAVVRLAMGLGDASLGTPTQPSEVRTS